MTININPKNKKSNLFQNNSHFSRKMRRSKHFQNLPDLSDDAQKIYGFLSDKKDLGKGTAYHIMSFFISLGFHNKQIFPTTSFLADRLGVHRKTISRVTGVLEALGLIRKEWRGFKQSRCYHLAPIFYDAQFQYLIYPLFTQLRAKAVKLFYDTGKFIEEVVDGLYSFFSNGVTHSIQCIYLNNNYKVRNGREYQKSESQNAPVNNNFKNLGDLIKNILNIPKKEPEFIENLSKMVLKSNEPERNAFKNSETLGSLFQKFGILGECHE